MQKCSNLSGLLAKSTSAPHRDEDGHIAPASNSSSYYFLISNYSWGLYLYMDFRTSSASSTRGILCMSPSFQLGGARLGNVPGNTSQYIHNTVCKNALFFPYIFSKCGITPSRRFLSPYNTSYRNNMGLPDIFNYFSYIV